MARRLPTLPAFLPEIPPPTPADVLYARPNPDGTRKACGNCGLWAPPNRCGIMGDTAVTKTWVCGYHFFSYATFGWAVQNGTPSVDPATSGLVKTREGTSCSNCAAFRPATSTCGAVAGPDGRYADVEPMGCCARWVQRTH
jgi:hypothetical protein